MKLTVHYEGQCIVIPCGDGSDTVNWLVKESVRRERRLVGSKEEPPTSLRLEARLDNSHGLLMKDDKICDVLDDNDVVFISSSLIKNKEFIREFTLQGKLSFTAPTQLFDVDGESMTPADLVACGKGERKIQITQRARERVQKSRELLDEIIESKKVVYGVNTGFGKFARIVIPDDKLKELQLNLIRSHAICIFTRIFDARGVGEPLSIERIRSMFALRINVLAKGYSGISPENLDKMIAIFNVGCVSLVPAKGTVGASGDLAPLAHLALGLLGEGQMWSPKTGWADSSTVLNLYGLKPLDLGPKEGLALINGTQMIAALGSEALERATAIARQADIVAAMTLEVLKGTTKAFSEEIHNVRPHEGQKLVASRIRSLLHSEIYPSAIAESHRFCDRVQDAYTLRCAPQVHGIAHDTIEFVRKILSVELNSATDNPMVFAEIGETMSGGNFHGEYPAKALDYLAIGVHELANMSERRLERLVNPAYSELPAFLTKEGGLNSGFMIAQCTAAALVSENKVLTHPSSVDSLTTSAGTEDHVSMGGFAARKALEVVEHVEYVLATELMAACQGIEFLRPLKSTEPLEAVHRLVRTVSKPLDSDRYFKPELDAVWKLLREEKVWKTAEPYVKNYEDFTRIITTESTSFSQPCSPTGYTSAPQSPAPCRSYLTGTDPEASNDSVPSEDVPKPKRKKLERGLMKTI